VTLRVSYIGEPADSLSPQPAAITHSARLNTSSDIWRLALAGGVGLIYFDDAFCFYLVRGGRFRTLTVCRSLTCCSKADAYRGTFRECGVFVLLLAVRGGGRVSAIRLKMQLFR